MKFLCIISDRFEDMEALATVDLLRRAGIQISIASIYNTDIVTGSYGTKVIPDLKLIEVEVKDFDGLFIPGGGHSFVIRNEESVKALVQEFYSHKKWLMAICAAPTIYGMMGIMDGVKYISFPGTENEMGKAIRMNDKKAIRDGQFITGRSVGVVYDFVFEIVNAVLGEEAIQNLKKNIVY